MTTSTDNYLKFRKSLHTVFNSESGKEVLDFLSANYVNTSAMDATTEATLYKLGQKEFVQGFIQDATADPAQVEEMVNGGKE